ASVHAFPTRRSSDLDRRRAVSVRLHIGEQRYVLGSRHQASTRSEESHEKVVVLPSQQALIEPSDGAEVRCPPEYPLQVRIEGTEQGVAQLISGDRRYADTCLAGVTVDPVHRAGAQQSCLLVLPFGLDQGGEL